jgi:HAD superfamily hydrolase (TIGR01662 family)
MARSVLAICLDFGDTLVDQSTEVKDETRTTLRGELIPGADKMTRELKRRGYKLAIVSNGPVGSIYNVLSQHSLYDFFDAFAISEGLGVEKPDPHIFIHALDGLGITKEDYSRTVMVGDNLKCDVKGANNMGMISIWIDWARRYPQAPADDSEVPQHTIRTPLDLLPLIESLEHRQGVGNK